MSIADNSLFPVSLQERREKPAPSEPWQKPKDDGGPAKPDVQRPDNRELLERMRRVDPDTARRYRQRSGQ